LPSHRLHADTVPRTATTPSPELSPALHTYSPFVHTHARLHP